MDDNSDIAPDTDDKDEGKKEKPSLRFWLSQLKAYDNIAKPWKSDVDDAFREYLNFQKGDATAGSPRKGGSEKSQGSHFPIFWSAVRTIQPALYARTPIIVAEKQFKEMRDPAARLASIMIERIGKYAVKTSGFDRSMAIAVTHFLMSEKVTLRVVFDASISQQQTKNYLNPISVPYGDHQMMMGMQYMNEQGEPYQGEGEPDQDDDGRYFYNGTQEQIDYLSCETEVPHYKDYRHTPNARHWGEIDWISFDSILTRTEFEETFGEETAKDVTFGPVGDKSDKGARNEAKGMPVYYATVTEIWDKKKKSVYYLCEGYSDWLTNTNNPDGGDPYQLEGFFPVAPFMLGTFGANDLFTSPAYVQLKDFIAQVHGAFDRVRRLILALKKAGIFDASKPELAELNAIASEGQFIGVADLDTLLGPGGSLEQLIQFFPTDKIAQGVDQLKTSMLDFENKFYDLWGIPDIYRGITDPNETLGAQQLKGKHMSVRFVVLQREVQRLARDTIEMMCDLYLAKCPEERLMEICGVKYMAPEDQQLAPQALQLLKDDTERCIRIDIETDSTITMDEDADVEHKNNMARTLFDGIASLKDLDPIFLPVAAKAVEMSVKALQQGKYIEGDLEQALDHLVQQVQQAAQQAASAPPPNPEMIKAQAAAQAQQAHTQSMIQINQQVTQADIAREDRKAQAKMAADQAGNESKAQLEQLKGQIAAQSAEHKAGLAAQLETHKATLDAQTSLFEQALDKLRLRHEADAELKSAAAFGSEPTAPITVHLHPPASEA